MKVAPMLSALACLLAGSSVMAWTITPIMVADTDAGSVRSISVDGRYVGGAHDNAAVTGLYPAYWDAQLGTFSNNYTNRGVGYVSGIDRTNSNTTLAVGGNMGSPAVGRLGGNLTPPALTVGTMKDAAGNNSAGVAGTYNCAAATTAGTDAWIAGWRDPTKGNEGYLWLGDAGASNPPTRTITGTGLTKLESVAAYGTGARVVGHDLGGPAGGDRAVWADTTGNALAIPVVPGGTGKGMGMGISANGTMFSGYMYPDPTVSSRLQGFIWQQGAASATMLKPAGGDAAMGPSATEQSVANDVTNDGYAVGYTWRTDTSNKGCIWLPGDLVAKRLEEWLPTIGVNMTGWTSLGTAVGITSLGGGSYAVIGDGIYNGKSVGYYVVVPEPASGFLLALAGLLVMRRRR